MLTNTTNPSAISNNPCECPSACSADVHANGAPSPFLRRPVAIAKPATAEVGADGGGGGKGKGKSAKGRNTLISKKNSLNNSANTNNNRSTATPRLASVAAHNRLDKGASKRRPSSSLPPSPSAATAATNTSQGSGGHPKGLTSFSRRDRDRDALNKVRSAGDPADDDASASAEDSSGSLHEEVARVFDVITMADGSRGYKCPQPGCGKICSRLPDCKKHQRKAIASRPRICGPCIERTHAHRAHLAPATKYCCCYCLSVVVSFGVFFWWIEMYTRPSPSLKLSSFPDFLLHVPPMLPLAMVGYTADISQPAPFFVWPASIWNVIVYRPDFKARTAMRGLSLAENQTAKRGLKTRPHVASTYALPVDASDGELDTCWLHRSSPHYCNGLPCTFFWHIPCHFSHTPRTYAMFRRIPFHQRTQNDTPCF